MSHVRKGMLAASKEWAVHLRPYGKRQFWGEHRQAEKAEAREQLEERDGAPQEGSHSQE